MLDYASEPCTWEPLAVIELERVGELDGGVITPVGVAGGTTTRVGTCYSVDIHQHVMGIPLVLGIDNLEGGGGVVESANCTASLL